MAQALSLSSIQGELMPIVRNFVVSETREVFVTAATPEEAIQRGLEAFRASSNSAPRPAGVRAPVQTKNLSAKES